MNAITSSAAVSAPPKGPVFCAPSCSLVLSNSTSTTALDKPQQSTINLINIYTTSTKLYSCVVEYKSTKVIQSQIESIGQLITPRIAVILRIRRHYRNFIKKYRTNDFPNFFSKYSRQRRLLLTDQKSRTI